jgi:hypothetical protein
VSAIGESRALGRLLLELPATVPLHRIDRVWIFAPRTTAARETGLVVLSLLGEPSGRADRRQLVTVRYEAESVRGAVRRTDRVTEEGWAPADRLSRLIAGVLARLGAGAEEPVERAVAGSAEAWAALLADLGVATLDRGRGE